MILVAVQGSMTLDAPAARAWFLLDSASRAEYGVDLTLSSPAGAYRDETLVLDMYLNKWRYGIPARQPVAKPRSFGGDGSVHENGRCIDINNWEVLGSKRLNALAFRFGFHPTIAAEPWHFEWRAGTATAGAIDAPILTIRRNRMFIVSMKSQTWRNGRWLIREGRLKSFEAAWDPWGTHLQSAGVWVFSPASDADFDSLVALLTDPAGSAGDDSGVIAALAESTARIIAEVPPAVIVEQKKSGN